MAYTGYNQARNKATQKYQKEHLEQIAIRVPKGKRQLYKDYADSKGKPLVKLITDLLDAEMRSNP